MYLDTNALNLISLFEQNGHAAYAVGGCVRDRIMGRRSSDTDIAVSCPPDITEQVLSKNNIRFVETGLKHGTVTAIVDSIPYEITTFRTESGYTDSRHPDSVTFVTSVEDDLSRRDFTVNAMAYSPSRGIVDLFGGREDIENKIIRTVGDPDARFLEDALRILRALRFASTLGFKIDKATSDSIIKNQHSLKTVARERITAELEKLLCGVNAAVVLSDYCGLFNMLLECDLSAKEYALIEVLPHDFALRLALLCDGSALVLSNTQKHRIATVRQNRDIAISCDVKALCRLMSRFGYDDARDILAFNLRTDALRVLKKIEWEGIPYSISHLAVNGNDLMSMGFRGAAIKTALCTALDAVIDGNVINEKQKILEYVKSACREMLEK